MTYSTLWLSQIQFFASLGFMLMFLVIELGLAWVLLYFKLRAFGREHAAWTAAYRFWVRVFALAFVLSFAASMPVLIQLGGLWPTLMEKIGDVAGPLLAAGILSTFIFKSCFLGAMLFGQRHLSEKLHALVVFMVALGVTASSFWMLALLSWMHVPTGARMLDERYWVIDWADIIFNPALPWYGGLFMLTGLLTAAFLVLGIIALQTLRRPVDESGRLVFKTAAWLAGASIVLQAALAAGAGGMTAQYQPAKAAAVSGYWHSGELPRVALFDASGAQDRAGDEESIWHAAAGHWLGRDKNGRYRGLDQFAGMAPPVAVTFWSYRLAAFTGLLMLLVAAVTLLRGRRRGFDPGALSRGWRRVLIAMSFSGWPMLLGGAAYVFFGSFPYAVTGTITVSEVTGDTPFDIILGGYLAYLLFYALFLAGFFQMLRHIVRYGVVPVARHRGRA
ncbi:MAG: cytochrome ubiquinol oxidase subunit I [Alcaligenaceae bacterium]|nr:cytochrome ubiquinol oxidase subunit I [Alcaligenaceae bacterium]